jgi:hypothetical protein
MWGRKKRRTGCESLICVAPLERRLARAVAPAAAGDCLRKVQSLGWPIEDSWNCLPIVS